MQVEIGLKNYRCFRDSRPARFSIGKGFTAIVGVNNSGKSSLLRFFREFRPLFGLLSSSGNFIEALRVPNSQGFTPLGSAGETAEVFCNINNRDLELEFLLGKPGVTSRQSPVLVPDRIILSIQRQNRIWTPSMYLSGKQLEFTNPRFQQNGTQLTGDGGQVVDLSPLFSACRALANTLYIGPFRNAINTGTNDNYFDIRVGQAFISAWRHLKSGPDRQSNEAAYSATDGIRRIFGFNALEINPSPDDRTLQIFIDGKSYRLDELGAGLTQFILVLANAAVRQPDYILIDEPELNLHASLQLDFLTTLGSFAKEGVLFSTHNIGLARAGADRIYTLRKGEDDGSEVRKLEDTPRLSELLGELSFSGYRELGFNRVVLVEGVTEVKTIQQFLRQRGKDHEILLLPLGGNQLIRDGVDIELEEVKRISENISALIDSERASAGAQLAADRVGFAEVCQRANISCHLLQMRAIENYFTDRAVKKVKGDKYRALQPYEKLAAVSPSWSKSENWRIAREMTLSELEGTDLGEFLNSL